MYTRMYLLTYLRTCNLFTHVLSTYFIYTGSQRENRPRTIQEYRVGHVPWPRGATAESVMRAMMRAHP